MWAPAPTTPRAGPDYAEGRPRLRRGPARGAPTYKVFCGKNLGVGGVVAGKAGVVAVWGQGEAGLGEAGGVADLWFWVAEIFGIAAIDTGGRNVV